MAVPHDASSRDSALPENSAPAHVLGAYEVWADYLRIAGTGVWVVWILASMPHRFLLWGPLLATFLMSLAAVFVTRRGLFPRWRRSAIVLLDSLLLTYFVWSVGAQTTTLTVLFVPLVVAVTMVGTPRASKVAVLTIMIAYSAVVLLQSAHLIPVAPLVSPQYRHERSAGGPFLAILSVATAVFGSYAFVLLARRRLERQAETERRLRLERQEAEKQNQALQHQLELSQRMESLGRLAGGIAHDFNNVLTAVVNNITLARDTLEPSSGAHRDLGEALRCSSQAAGVVRQMLAFSRRDAGEARVVQTADVVTSARALLSRVIREDVAIQVEQTPPVPNVWIDPTRLEQVLLNLAVNSSDAIRGKGTITVGLGQTTILESDRPSWHDLAPGEYARIDFQDDGVGMDDATLARAFDPFFTTKPRSKGTGIGLSIVFSIVHNNGGAVRLVSTPGQGTTVTILLPATHHAPRVEVQPVNATTTASGLVLLVEDQEDVRRATLRLLDRRGYRVLAAASAEEALELVAEREIEPDVLVTDVMMPGISGPALSRRLREKFPRMHVVLMSGHMDSELGDEEQLDESTEFLGKPFEPAELIAHVSAALNARAGRRD